MKYGGCTHERHALWFQSDKHWNEKHQLSLDFAPSSGRAVASCFHHIHLQTGFSFLSLAWEPVTGFQAFSPQLCLSVYTAVALTFPQSECVCFAEQDVASLSKSLEGVRKWQIAINSSALYFSFSEAENSPCFDNLSRSLHWTPGQVSTDLM